MSIRYDVKPKEVLDHYLIPSPQTKYHENIPANELKRLLAIEEQSLNFIRQQVANQSLEVGGIILEPISVSQGIHFFRKEFLLRLRALADELGVPIMADEIFTGGGRTGQFWAFQHYEDFFPDLISFGKGLELKGVGWIKRWPLDPVSKRTKSLIWDFPRFNPLHNALVGSSYQHMRLDNTSIASATDVARALVVLETINKMGLTEHARAAGKEILDRARSQALKMGLSPNRIQGIGLVFHFSDYIEQLFPKYVVSNYEGRVTPYLTTELSDWPGL